MHPSPLSSLSFSSVSFLQFALALFEQLLVHSLLSLSFSSSLSFTPAFFISLFPRSVALSHFGNPDSITSPFCFFQIFLIHIYTLFLFHSIEIFIIESRSGISRAICSYTEICYAFLLSPFSRHAIVPNLRPARFRSFYRTVDFDGFIRTLYSLPLYSRDLKSLIISATRGAEDQAR